MEHFGVALVSLCLWFTAWFCCACGFILCPKLRDGLVHWVGWLEKVFHRTCKVPKRLRGKFGLLVRMSMYGLLVMIVSAYLLFTTPLAMVACLITFMRRR